MCTFSLFTRCCSQHKTRLLLRHKNREKYAIFQFLFIKYPSKSHRLHAVWSKQKLCTVRHVSIFKASVKLHRRVNKPFLFSFCRHNGLLNAGFIIATCLLESEAKAPVWEFDVTLFYQICFEDYREGIHEFYKSVLRRRVQPFHLDIIRCKLRTLTKLYQN